MSEVALPISSTREQLNFTSDEQNILWRLRNRKLLFLSGAYLSLSWVLIDVWSRVYAGNYWEAIKELFRFRIYPIWYLWGLFIILTIYFTRYFLKSVYPLIKDLKAGKKLVIYFVPGRYQTPFFAEYYLQTPSQRTPLVRISKEVYDSIRVDTTASISVSPYSRFVFSIEVNGIKQKFNFSTEIDDL